MNKKMIWITGLAGQGKTTLVDELKSFNKEYLELHQRNLFKVFDADIFGYHDISGRWIIPESVVELAMDYIGEFHIIFAGICENIEDIITAFNDIGGHIIAYPVPTPDKLVERQEQRVKEGKNTFKQTIEESKESIRFYESLLDRIKPDYILTETDDVNINLNEISNYINALESS